MTAGALLVSLPLLAWLGRREGIRPAFGWVSRAFLNGIALVFWVNLPLGPEDRVVRRQPWVTWTIVGLCVAVFQLQLLVEPGPAWRREVERARDEAVTYAVSHPDLQVPPVLATYAGSEVARGREAARPVPSPTDWVRRAREQAELEEKSRALFALLRQKGEFRWADVPALSTWWTRLTSDFVHGGYLHLLGNLLFLVAFAPYLEDVYGRALFGALYLGAGAFSGLLTVAADRGSYVFCLGASGAIAGVMGAFLVRFGTRRLTLVNIPSLWLPVLRVTFSAPACVFLLLSFALDVRGAMLGIRGVGWWAHIGGFVFGVLFAGVLRLSRIEQHLINPLIEASLTLRPHPAVEKSSSLRAKGLRQAAQRAVEAALVSHPLDPDVLREAYDAAVAAGALDRAGTHATRLVALLGRRTGRDDLRETLLFVEEARATLGAALPARFYFAAGDCLERQGQSGEALRLYKGLLSHREVLVVRCAGARLARLRASLGAGAEPRRQLAVGRA
jgi:membrane associated rhomboid family serine protease